MVRRRLLTLCAVIAVASVACSSGDDAAESPSGTVATAAPETTTTTELTVEEEVEAAYLRSWDVYAQAMRTLDTKDLGTIFVGAALELRENEVRRLKLANTPARMEIDHDFTIAIADDGQSALVVDHYVNHSVLIDPASGEPTEPDPNDIVRREYEMRLMEDRWLVTDVFEG